MRRLIAASLFALPLAACGNPASTTAVAMNNAADTGYIARVLALPGGQQRGVVFRAIRDGGQSCSQLTSYERAPDQNGRPVWTAACADGGRWTVILSDDGTASVTGAGPKAG